MYTHAFDLSLDLSDKIEKRKKKKNPQNKYLKK